MFSTPDKLSALPEGVEVGELPAIATFNLEPHRNRPQRRPPVQRRRSRSLCQTTALLLGRRQATGLQRNPQRNARRRLLFKVLGLAS